MKYKPTAPNKTVQSHWGQHRKENSSIPLFLLLILLGLTPRLAWEVQAPPRLLLDHAAKVAKVKDAAMTCWLSDHTLLVVTSDKHKGYLRPDEWKGKAQLLDTRTHCSIALSGLTRMLRHWRFEPHECKPVLGGKWLFWIAAETPDHYPNALISTRDGSHYYQWNFTKGHSEYWLNDHLWIDQDRFPGYPTYPRLHIHDVYRPQWNKHLRMDALATRHWLTQHAAAPFCFEALSDQDKGGHQQPLCIGKYHVADYHLQEHPRPLHTYRIPLPAGVDVQAVEVSPDQRKVLIETTSKQWTTLWTCRVDGRHLHSLGTIRRKEGRYCLGATWLPGSSKITFDFDDTLYTVNSD